MRSGLFLHLLDIDSLLFFGKKGTFEALEGDSLITLVIDFVGKCAKHQEFFTRFVLYEFLWGYRNGGFI